jgi:Ca2+-transporting ATPase
MSATFQGLSAAEAGKRLEAVGANELARQEATPAWRQLAAQFGSPLVGLLIVAGAISIWFDMTADAIAIGAIVLLNGIIGFLQEHRAERAIHALRALSAPRARVLREGHAAVIEASQVVPGDILLIEAGDIVAADATVLEANVLSTIESALTGESLPAQKSVTPAPDTAPLAEQSHRVFAGTAVATGSGVAEVTATGMRTELGRIAHLLATVEDEHTPLQRQLVAVSRMLLIACLAVVGIVALAGFVRGLPLVEILLSAVSLAVAAVPEGLPAVVTIALAVGVQRMAARNALVRRMLAVETLGATTVICTDKTGTLTTGVMRVREIWGDDPRAVIDAAAACSDAELSTDGAAGVGDPTEVAILMAAAERGIHRGEIEATRARVHVNPFDSDRKRMSILRADGVLYVKGAAEAVMARSRSVPEGFAEALQSMAARGLRVLAVAVGEGRDEEQLRMLGLLGLADPPRREAIDAISLSRGAGIVTVMITGDHPVTASAIARELGLLAADEPTEERVHARATPEDKLRIVRQWKSGGHVVAMTGDGVNDAPALREAHIGIAMGRTGTEVTREAADIVLTDDNYASIVAAVEAGRAIFDNIRKTLVYLLSGNAAELLIMLVAAAAGLPLPLLPLHLLWINLATDGVPALALVTDPARPDVMQRPPRNPAEPILGRVQWRAIAITALLQTVIVLGVFVWALDARGLDTARNLAFSTLVFGELLRAFAARDERRPIWAVGIFSNLKLLIVVAASVVVQILIHHIPVMQQLFHITPLSASDCVLTLTLGCLPWGALELAKLRARAP